MRPHTITINFEAPERALFSRITNIRSTILANKDLQNRDVILKIINDLQGEIGQLQARNRRATELDQLNEHVRNFVRIFTEANNFVTHYENLFNQVDPADKSPEEILLEVLKKANPDSEIDEMKILGFAQDVQMFTAQSTRIRLVGRSAITILESHFGLGIETDSDAEDDQDVSGYPVLERLEAVRAEVQKSINALHRMQDDRKLPHHCFGLYEAFEETRDDMEDHINQFLQCYHANDELLERVARMMGHPIPESSVSSPLSSATHNSSGFFAGSSASSSPSPRRPSPPASTRPPSPV